MLGTITDDVHEFRAPQTMTPGELGDSLARLVWESFSDFVSREDVETPLPDVDTISDDKGATHRTAEEALIFFMWAHTRGAQLAFLGRAPDQRLSGARIVVGLSPRQLRRSRRERSRPQWPRSGRPIGYGPR